MDIHLKFCDEVPIKCSGFKKCKQELTRKLMFEHECECEASKILCTKGCDKYINRDDEAHHNCIDYLKNKFSAKKDNVRILRDIHKFDQIAEDALSGKQVSEIPAHIPNKERILGVFGTAFTNMALISRESGYYDNKAFDSFAPAFVFNSLSTAFQNVLGISAETDI